jgi:hypothetical protein
MYSPKQAKRVLNKFYKTLLLYPTQINSKARYKANRALQAIVDNTKLILEKGARNDELSY